MQPTESELARLYEVLESLRAHIRTGTAIRLDRSPEAPFAGTFDEYRYLFEGEDDLLHLVLERTDGALMDTGETLAIARRILPGVPEAMVWLRPGRRAHHYYLGHDLLLTQQEEEQAEREP